MNFPLENFTGAVLNKIAKRLLKAKKNTIIVLAIVLSTLLFASLFTIAISLQEAMQDSDMRKIGTCAHAGIKHISIDEYNTVKVNPKIKASGYSVIIGSAVGECFTKVPTEVRWANDTYSKWTFNYPSQGHLPEKDNELATSKIVLEAMGVDAKLGQEIELSYLKDDEMQSDKFTLCGIWDGDLVSYRQTILLAKGYMSKNAPAVHGKTDEDIEDSTGYVDCIFKFPTAWNIEKKTKKLVDSCDLSGRASINTAYGTTNINLSSCIFILIAVFVILFAGYLLIYNVFYISIAQDIGFYGILKTLGTTMKQIKKIVYKKASYLSVIGIPLGLILGWIIGRLLLPFIVNLLGEDMHVITTGNPIIFIISTILTLITVYLSCRKPAKIASKISPIEALRYIDKSPESGKKNKRKKRISCLMLARENLTRNRKKVVIVTLSFSLSIVLLNSVYTYINSFDFDKFVSDISLTDFTISNVSIIKSNSPFNTSDVSKEFTSIVEELDGLKDNGNIYLYSNMQPFDEVSLGRLKKLGEKSPKIKAEYENYKVRGNQGVNIYGLDDFPAEYLQLIEGNMDIEKWKSGKGIYVTQLEMLENGKNTLYHRGDKVSISCSDGTENSYEVLAVVKIPDAFKSPLSIDMGLNYILPSSEILNKVCTKDYLPMTTIFNVEDSYINSTENWLKIYTSNVDSTLDYWSKKTLRHTFQGMISMYTFVGGTLCGVLALIGILNFINSMTTSVLSRHKEIAMLQSVGMTGKQLKKMLIYEGIGYSILGILCSLVLSVLADCTIVKMLGAELTYFTWHFTVLPVVLCIIPLAIISVAIPYKCYKSVIKKTVVERLCEKE